ncbi:hypothetical protein WN51_09376 [Melipona quadrifasciata]|uniref:Uncharacterized protein n=1 Tax=Melipona quadrifasciata TaxID=166423 RepID=A0A0N0BIH4_9HYME|nr:hypothetical protein WN51_09376 [Melipona quadrifasciata]
MSDEAIEADLRDTSKRASGTRSKRGGRMESGKGKAPPTLQPEANPPLFSLAAIPRRTPTRRVYNRPLSSRAATCAAAAFADLARDWSPTTSDWSYDSKLPHRWKTRAQVKQRGEGIPRAGVYEVCGRVQERGGEANSNGREGSEQTTGKKSAARSALAGPTGDSPYFIVAFADANRWCTAPCPIYEDADLTRREKRSTRNTRPTSRVRYEFAWVRGAGSVASSATSRGGTSSPTTPRGVPAWTLPPPPPPTPRSTVISRNEDTRTYGFRLRCSLLRQTRHLQPTVGFTIAYLHLP